MRETTGATGSTAWGLDVSFTRSRSYADALIAAMVWVCACVVTAGFLWILGDVLVHGLRRVSVDFLVDAPSNAGRAGGIGPVLVSTGLILAVCLAVSVPIGLGTAVFLTEFSPRGGWLGSLIRRSLDVLAGVPSIVFGLVGNAVFVVWLGWGYSILAGGLTLACMVLPLLIRATEQGLAAVPDDYRRSAAALGLTRPRWVVSVVLPLAVPGLAVGLVLGIGRALAETAALLFTSGYVDRMPTSLMDSGRSLSIHIYDLAMNISGGEPSAYATALVLLAMLVAINLAASWAARRVLGARMGDR